MNFLEKVFHEVNSCPMSIINKTIQQELNYDHNEIKTPGITETPYRVKLILPCSGKQSKKVTEKKKKNIKKTLPEDTKTIMTYQSKKATNKISYLG